MADFEKHTPKFWSRDVNGEKWYLVWCPGCGCGHSMPTPRWKFNGDFVSPTFTPSMRIYTTDPETKQERTLCHFFVSAGKIQYQNDCAHKFNGQTIEMQDIPPDYGF